jgi:hypothetical protein
MCECARPGCFPTELPHGAWEFAGNAGEGKGPAGVDLIAVHPDHTDGYTVRSIREGFVAVLANDKWAKTR